MCRFCGLQGNASMPPPTAQDTCRGCLLTEPTRGPEGLLCRTHWPDEIHARQRHMRGSRTDIARAAHTVVQLRIPFRSIDRRAGSGFGSGIAIFRAHLPPGGIRRFSSSKKFSNMMTCTEPLSPPAASGVANTAKPPARVPRKAGSSESGQVALPEAASAATALQPIRSPAHRPAKTVRKHY
jgi:hypothetical protein